MIQVIPVRAFSDNYIWLIRLPEKRSPDRPGGHAVIVDPGDVPPVLDALDAHQMKPAAILVTHHHHDHVGGIAGLLARFTVPVYGPAGMRNSPVDHPLQDGDTVTLGQDLSLRVIAVPGHAADHLAYYGGDLLFCGDTLFTGGCGRLIDGTASQLYASLERLSALPDRTRVYCGHEYTLSNLRFASRVEPGNLRLAERLARAIEQRDRGLATVPSTLAEEKATNPFLRCHLAAVRGAAERFCDKPLNTSLEVFAMIRSWKDAF